VTLRRVHANIVTTEKQELLRNLSPGIRHAMRMRRFVIGGLTGCAMFFHINDFILKKKLLNIKACFIFL
jgi:hypothetical protein